MVNMVISPFGETPLNHSKLEDLPPPTGHYYPVIRFLIPDNRSVPVDDDLVHVLEWFVSLFFSFFLKFLNLIKKTRLLSCHFLNKNVQLG